MTDTLRQSPEIFNKRIQIPGDELVTNDELAAEWDCTTRTVNRYDEQGLPYVMVAGRKYRPLRLSREWLARRIREPNPKRRRRAMPEAIGAGA